MTKVAIMQPTYLPWCGYFGLMMKVDIFILLDSVQFTRRSWQQRNLIKTPRGSQWLTVPVINKEKREQLISEVEIDNSTKFSKKHRKSIEINYHKSVFFKDFGPKLIQNLNETKKLVDLNIGLIDYFRDVLNLKTKVLRSSNMNGKGVKADLLASLCLEVDATEYIAVQGSKNYLDHSRSFNDISLPIHYFNFNHPSYPQLYNGFIPNMSILDMIFNCGEKSTQLIKSGFMD